MPTYSYRCTECDNAFDIHQSFSDDTLTVCPVCGGKLRKVFSPVGVTFNGSGFYRTDSRAKTSSSSDGGSSSGAGSDSGSGSGSAAKVEGAGSGGSAPKESKPSTPAPSKPATSGGSTPSS
ncbi:FmdB family transcriptional regulator [Frondihabitans sp. PAMC 28766]|uniref:FmdB family zinc ribbon protein n=1 Tax=Frondihabitans sp. PAMC 28766 TaxID=1795630 RepID=UPI00078C3CEB|nr:FmdB family zinc ribbon protein [Frondihabitans sp. PAMC 28766]AMM20079.1 FmdB family transcriptional regulator [Frondihabitans sp. PAMC 28766]